MNWYLLALKKYATFQGRSQRKEFWVFLLINTLIGLSIEFTILLIQSKTHINLIGIPALYHLLIFLPSISVGVRRMHDIGLSGWWIIAPFANLIFAALDSQPGNNRFGPNPKGVLFKSPSFIPERYLLPIGRSSWAIAAGYLGLFSALFIPAPLALFCGIKALKDISNHPEKMGRPRAIFGIVMGGVGTIILVSVCIFLADMFH